MGKRLSESCPPSAVQVAENGGEFQGRTGVITTPTAPSRPPPSSPSGTKATVKSVLPESMAELGAQALLSNAYHLYLQPGADILDAAGGLGKFMNWQGPTFTDSGGFQVMSLGSGFKKVINMDAVASSPHAGADDSVAVGKERLAHIDDDGVWFKSHLNGDMHRFTPEISMQVQHQIGADIMFAFDELTTLLNSRGYQEMSLERTRLWALRCIAEHFRLTEERVGKPYQALFGVIQGAQYEDLRRKASHDLGAMNFDGYGIGGALEKENLGTIVRWCSEELPENKPRHLLGISEPDDIFTAIENGADTFDCVSPTRVARTSAFYTPDGRFNLSGAKYKRDFTPAVRGVRLLHLRKLHPRLHPPPVQGQGDGLGNADLHPQRALRGEDGGRRPPGHRGRHLLRVQGRDPAPLLLLVRSAVTANRPRCQRSGRGGRMGP